MIFREGHLDPCCYLDIQVGFFVFRSDGGGLIADVDWSRDRVVRINAGEWFIVREV